jgi:hypothetical protein
MSREGSRVEWCGEACARLGVRACKREWENESGSKGAWVGEHLEGSTGRQSALLPSTRQASRRPGDNPGCAAMACTSGRGERLISRPKMFFEFSNDLSKTNSNSQFQN